jgi:hypothetical protein
VNPPRTINRIRLATRMKRRAEKSDSFQRERIFPPCTRGELRWLKDISKFLLSILFLPISFLA